MESPQTHSLRAGLHSSGAPVMVTRKMVSEPVTMETPGSPFHPVWERLMKLQYREFQEGLESDVLLLVGGHPGVGIWKCAVWATEGNARGKQMVKVYLKINFAVAKSKM